jgi:hypothetical protein
MDVYVLGIMKQPLTFVTSCLHPHNVADAHQVQWQETLSGQVAGILTTWRVLIASASLSILASTSATADRGYPPISSQC